MPKEELDGFDSEDVTDFLCYGQGEFSISFCKTMDGGSITAKNKSQIPQKTKVKYRKKQKSNTAKNKSQIPQKSKIVLLIHLLLVTLSRNSKVI